MTIQKHSMKRRQRGSLNLFWVAIFSALLAAAAMAALFSMRNERNLFAEGWAKLVGAAPAKQALSGARKAIDGAGLGAAAAGSGVLRTCRIKGKMVVSDTECTQLNPTSKVVKALDNVGFEAPKAVAPPEAAPKSDPALDQIIAKQTR